MSTQVHLDEVRRAWEARDPAVVRLIELLAEQPDEAPKTPIRQGAMTFTKFIAEVRSKPFHKKPAAEQAHYRIEQLKALESPTAEVPLPDRLKVHEVIYRLWEDNGPLARRLLLETIATVKLTYGPWKALKRIFKESEVRGDTEIYGALAARFDAAFAASGKSDVSRNTLGYLVRRAWRYLRRTGETLPAVYPDTACDVLACYPADTNFNGTWIANHIFYHETENYGRATFHYSYYSKPPESLTKHRAFGDAWRRSPRPLFSLLERAKSDKVWQFAAEALKTDFRAVLREVEPAWVTRLVGVGSAAVDDFVVWVLSNVPRFEQGAFKQLGLHDTVLRLFDSRSEAAAGYAAEYARTHARDLPVERLIRLANSPRPSVRKLAADLLGSRDPRKDVGLDAWGRLLETEHGHKLAADVIRKHFGAKELTPEWFKARLFSESDDAFEFAKGLLPQVHPFKGLGPAYFADLIDSIDDPQSEPADRVADFALDQLAKFDLDALDVEFLKRLLVNPLTADRARKWIDEGRLTVQTVPPDFFKVLAYHPMWEADPWLAELKASGRKWAKGLTFDESRADQVLEWMKDVRKFPPSALGFDWLMQLVSRSEPRYHDFAVETAIKAFVPADFAPKAAARGEEKPAANKKGKAAAPAVDLKAASFVFTGKLATMTRKEAEEKVSAANGTNFDAVSSKLHYLVIGDEGSPLYGAGKKGSKQVKAEQINAGGGNIKIISETAFLKMLAGEQQEASSDATQAGLNRLWDLAISPGGPDAPLAAFARRYIRRHHPDIALAETDRPVDPGAEVPPTFLSFDRLKPLFSETRKPLRDFALELAKWEFARWSPPAEEIIRLSEVPFADVRQFVANALLADESPEHKRYRIDPASLTPMAVYSFVESADEKTRELGMELIRRQPRLQVPEELFRLTESPDRKVRAFVVNALRSLYRDRGITEGWKPAPPPPAPTTGAAAKRTAAQQAKAIALRGPGAPVRPDHLPAEAQAVRHFLRRSLFEVPPGRLPPSKLDGQEDGEAAKPAAGAAPATGGQAIQQRLKPLSTREAKLALIETLRDVAVDEVGFASVVLPLLDEFLASKGKSEHAATLVAVTRIRHTHPGLAPKAAVVGRG